MITEEYQEARESPKDYSFAYELEQIERSKFSYDWLRNRLEVRLAEREANLDLLFKEFENGVFKELKIGQIKRLEAEVTQKMRDKTRKEALDYRTLAGTIPNNYFVFDNSVQAFLEALDEEFRYKLDAYRRSRGK